jgi:hypothetical protein
MKPRLHYLAFASIPLFIVALLTLATLTFSLLMYPVRASIEAGYLVPGFFSQAAVLIPLLLLALLESLGLLGMLLLRPSIDAANLTLSVPFWRYYQQYSSEHLFLPGARTNALAALFYLFARQRSFSFSEISSVLVCRANKLTHFAQYYDNETNRNLMLSYAALVSPESRRGALVQQSVAAAPRDIPTSLAVSGALIFLDEAPQTPLILVIQTHDDLVLSSLAMCYEPDVAYFIELLRTKGLRVLTAPNASVHKAVAAGRLYPKRTLSSRNVKLLALLVVSCLLLFAELKFDNCWLCIILPF